MCRRLLKSEESSEVKSCRGKVPVTWVQSRARHQGSDDECPGSPITKAPGLGCTGPLWWSFSAGRVEEGVKIFRDDTSPDV